MVAGPAALSAGGGEQDLLQDGAPREPRCDAGAAGAADAAELEESGFTSLVLLGGGGGRASFGLGGAFFCTFWRLGFRWKCLARNGRPFAIWKWRVVDIEIWVRMWGW